MTKLLGSILAALVVLQGAIPSLGLPEPEVNLLAVIVAMGVGALTFFLKGEEPEVPSVTITTSGGSVD